MLREIRTQLTRWGRNGWFPTFWSFIGMVSALDIYLIERFRGVLASLEENPVGRFLIELDGGDVGVFIRAKLAGTVLVLSVLAGLYVYRRRWSFPVTASVAAFQFGLLTYLILSKPPHRDDVRSNGSLVFNASSCVEAFHDGIIAVLPDSGEQPLSVRLIRRRMQARLRDNAGPAPR